MYEWSKRVKKMSNKLYGSCITGAIIFFIITFAGESVLKKIEIGNYNNIYKTIVNFWPGAPDFFNSVGCKFISIIIVILTLMLIFARKYRKKAMLIKHSSLGHDITQINSNLSKEFKFKIFDINVTKEMNQGDIKSAVKRQDDCVNEIIDLIQKQQYKDIFYYGIAHTPLVFRLGFQVGPIVEMRFLHKKRTDRKNETFDELSEYETDERIYTPEYLRENEQSKSNSLLFAFASTYEIKRENLFCFDTESSHILKISTDQKDHDFFNSYHRMRIFSRDCVKHIRETCKKFNISKMHMVLSTSVNYTCLLAQKLGDRQTPELIVYHYENPTYPWGISIKNNSQDAIINNQ